MVDINFNFNLNKLSFEKVYCVLSAECFCHIFSCIIYTIYVIN